MALEFQLQLAMTEISARNCLDEKGHSLSAKSVARVQKNISEEKLIIVCLLNVVKICGSSLVGSFFFLNDTFYGAKSIQSVTLHASR